jgi:hypothetical protein
MPPSEAFILESLVATTYQVDFEFFEEELLAAALGVRSPVSRLKAFRSELERKLQRTEVSVLYDFGGCERLARLSPRIDAIPVAARKLHSKISLLMWVRESASSGAPPERRMRVLVGSANLTRQGFRNNYECVASLDFGGKSTSPRTLLTRAVGLVQQIGAESQAPQFQRQVAAFSAQAALLAVGTPGSNDPVELVAAHEVLPTIRGTWSALSSKAPVTATLVSPFWIEGSTASEALADLIVHLGSPANVELICRGEKSADGGSWLPVFDKHIAVDLKNRTSSRIFLRPSLPDAGVADSSPSPNEIGDELEEREFAAKLRTESRNGNEMRRTLHAKIILLDGMAGSVLYAGSSNCTRRGLSLGGAPNHEAGLVYRLTPRQRRRLAALLEFAGPACEVCSGVEPATVQPADDQEVLVPTFLADVVASGTLVTARFREAVPSDLILLMPIPTKAGSAGFWLLFRAESQDEAALQDVTANLALCPRCDERLVPISVGRTGKPPVPNVLVEVRWQGHSANFPVRFDDKSQLPLLLVGRRPTEGELIDYFLFGTEPEDAAYEGLLADEDFNSATVDAPVDTRRILAYFIRRFVQAIPGIEAELGRAAYSRAPLEAALRGPTSPLQLAERAYESFKTAPAKDEPPKTPTAVGFQLTEILAALRRCRDRISDRELRGCFLPVETRCREMLDSLVAEHSDLQSDAFRRYRDRIWERAR